MMSKFFWSLIAPTIVCIVLANLPATKGQANCESCNRRSDFRSQLESEAKARKEWTKPEDCKECVQRTVHQLLGTPDQRTNSIQDFCILTDMHNAPTPPIGPPFPATAEPHLKNGTYGLFVPEEETCYKPVDVPVAAPEAPKFYHHTAGQDPNWKILDHLVAHKAQSYQPFDDLPYVQSFLYRDGYLTLQGDQQYYRKAEILPMEGAPNPYFVEVTGVSVKGELLHNFLHFRIFANMSVALGKDQLERHRALHIDYDHGRDQADNEQPNFITGKISALLIMVKDQDGWPVGDFSKPVPCKKTCKKYSHSVYYGDERNALPCSYTPPYASSHPGMFVFDVDPGRYCTKPFPGPPPCGSVPPCTPIKKETTCPAHNCSTPTEGKEKAEPAPPPPSGNSSSPDAPAAPIDPRSSANTARMEGVREVHATWSFGHSTCNFVQRLYIQTLIFEDVETIHRGTFGIPKNAPGDPGYKIFDKFFLFGWTAQYNVIKPTRSSLGAPDYVDLDYLRKREEKGDDIDCHVPIFDGEKTVPSNFKKFFVPRHDIFGLSEALGAEVPSRQGYLGALWGIWKGQPEYRYFGQHSPPYPIVNLDNPPSGEPGSPPPASGSNPSRMCRDLPKDWLVNDNVKIVFGNKHPSSLAKFLTSSKEAGVRCPCPALPSTLPPENATADPARLHGRLIHASHMAIAYMLLTPIACFVARYYKETFIHIFCFQEYWWFMWHVVILVAACLFNIGAITSIARKKDQQQLVTNSNLIIHEVLGAMSIFVFYMEIITGFFRVADPKKRMRQIFMHWLIGVTNNACAVGSMFAMAWIDQSGFSCNVAYTLVLWLIFVVTCYVVMEKDMRKTDKELRFIPRRSYLPPPVKRLFTKEPPGRLFRLGMLGIFIFGLIVIQCMVSYFIWNAEDGASCEEEYRASEQLLLANLIPEEQASDGGADGGQSYNY